MKHPIVIVGGMGPQASLRFHELLLQKSKKHHSGKASDFPFIVHFSLPIVDFISDESLQEEAKKEINKLSDSIAVLQPSTITLACNTAHLLVPQIGIFKDNPQFVSMIEEVATRIESNGIRRIGLLASPSTIRSKLYESTLSTRSVKTILPSVQQLQDIEVAIREVIAGKAGLDTQKRLTDITEALRARGAEAILLGCTELPLIFPLSKKAFGVFNCLDIYAEAVIEKYYLYNGA